LGRFEIAILEPGLSHRLHPLVRSRFGYPHPGHPPSAFRHQNPANLLHQAGIFFGQSNHFVAVAEHAQGAHGLAFLIFRFPSFYDLPHGFHEQVKLENVGFAVIALLVGQPDHADDFASAEDRYGEVLGKFGMAVRITFFEGMGSGKIVEEDRPPLPDRLAPNAGSPQMPVLSSS